MRARIQKSLFLILSATLLISYILISVIVYRQNLSILKTEVKQEAKYICTAIDITGPEYLEQLDMVEVDTRVTRIDT